MKPLLLTGDCREALWSHGPFDMILADPPYGDTSLSWDQHVRGWEDAAGQMMKPTGSIWVFGSMRFFMATADRFAAAGWRYAQDVVWEKQNGSGWAADRFKRVHEHAVQFYRADAPWGAVFNDVQRTHGHKKLKVSASRQGAAHAGSIKKGEYVSDGERIMRSVIPLRSCHSHAIHPTEKPVGLLQILIRTSCPPGGLVGDFFAGSGAGGEAAAQAGRRYVGAEVDAEMAEKARRRLGSNLFGAAA